MRSSSAVSMLVRHRCYRNSIVTNSAILCTADELFSNVSAEQFVFRGAFACATSMDAHNSSTIHQPLMSSPSW